jgi:Fe2+ or Zn2+ uptake regulation protein
MDLKILNSFKDRLKENKLSVTKTRLEIFELLYKKEPQSIHELLDKSNAHFDRVTLYRIINLFEKINVSQRVYSGWKYKIELTDSFSGHHHHLTCLTCVAIIPIAEDEHVERLIFKLAEDQGFAPQGHQLEIQGYCQKCLIA